MPNIFIRILIIALLPLLSGAAALSHELLWTRRLVDLLGATDWVIGRVLGMFFLGISIGGFLATRIQSRTNSPLKRLAITELLIGVLALPAAFLPAWTDWIWPMIGTELLVSWQGHLIKFLLASVVVLPPAIAMGFTLPLFVRSATDFGSSVAKVGIWIYTLNTLGGVFGLWFTSTFLVQWLGAQATMLSIIVINIFIASAAMILSKTLESGQSVDEDSLAIEKSEIVAASKSSALSKTQILLLSFFSGLFILSLEILILRLIALVAPSSYHTTSAMLANVILILAFSSLLISAMNQFVQPNRWPLIIGLIGTASFCCFCPVILYQQTEQLIALKYLQGINDRTIETINHYWILVFWLIASAGGMALLFGGLVFPALLSLSSESDPTGARIGVLLAVNGIGGLIGSEVTNSVFLPLIGIYFSFLLLAGLIACVVAAFLYTTNRQLAIGVGCAMGLVIFFGYENSSGLPYISPQTKTKFKVEATHFGPEGVLQVVKDEQQSKSILMNNQYRLGSTGFATDERRQLLLPWLLNPKAKSLCSLGLATGISASGLEMIENPPAITAVELSANVAQLAESHFQSESRGFFERNENRVEIEDARTFIAAATDQFDIIVADLFRPHGNGEGRLFALEHFQNVKRALKSDGLFCQWLPIHQLNETNFKIIAATLSKVFPETLVVFGNANVNTPVLGLVAKKSGEKWDSATLNSQISNLESKLLQDDPLLRNAKDLFIGKLNREAFAEVPLNTLDNLRVEISAGNFWILQDLRRDRPESAFENSFLSGKNLIEFINRLKRYTTPVFNKSHDDRFLKLLKDHYTPPGRRTKKNVKKGN